MLNALVVDDEEEICDCLKEQLEEIQFSVLTAVSGEQALQIIHAKEIHLAVIDIKLSTTITGVDVLRALKKKWPRAVLVAMSGYVDIGIKQEIDKLGVNANFMKPDDVSWEAFNTKIQELMKNRGKN